MNNISIVTAFFDIGRGNWTPDKGLPPYLYRPTEIYMERFEYLAQLDNEMVIFTTCDLAERVKKLRQNHHEKTKVVTIEPRILFSERRDKIFNIQKNLDYQKKIDPCQIRNPEYWNPDYVLITNLKAYLTNLAVTHHLVTNEMVAWIDFGYCRTSRAILPTKRWRYHFNPDKIHLFHYKNYHFEKTIEEIIATNDVYILGAKVIAHRKLWTDLDEWMKLSYQTLENNNWVDDDQSLWLMSYLIKPELFELHRIPDPQYGYDPFILFHIFNE